MSVDTATFVLITGFISSIGAILLAVMTNLQGVKKAQFDSVLRVTDELQEQNDRQRNKINELEALVAKLIKESYEKDHRIHVLETSSEDKDRRINDLESTVETLTKQLRSLGHEPDTRPRPARPTE